MPNFLNPLPAEFSLPIPTVDNSLLTGKIDGSLLWTDQNSLFYKPIDNIIYVTKNGKDTNSGKSLIFAKRSIKSALNAAKSGTTIVIASGLYKEYTPLICPPNVTITAQDSLVQVEAYDNTKDVFYLNNGVIIDGVTVINTRSPSFAFSLGTNSEITKTPIVKNCSVISGPFLNDGTLFIPNQTIQIEEEGSTLLPIIDNDVPELKQIDNIGSGNGILVDGEACTINSLEKLIIVDSCKIFSQGGIGILVKNSAKCHVNLSEIGFCDKAYVTETGGQLILNSCISSYGNYGLYANGYSNDFITGLVESATVYPETGLIGQIKIKNLIKQPIVGAIIDINNEKYKISNATLLENNSSYISIISNLSSIEIETEIKIYNDSRIIANNHYFKNVGSGVTYNALPENNGRSNELHQINEVNFGSIFYSSSNADGIFKIGNLFEINQITGSITSSPTAESLINIGSIGPLIRNGVPVGVAVKEISDNNQLIASTGIIDSYTVPTQTAVYSYLNNNYLPLTGGIVSGPTTIQDIKFTDNVILSNEDNQNIIIAPNGTGAIDVDFSNIINLAEPINDNDAATKKFVVDLVQGGVTVPSVIPIIWGSIQDNESLILRSTKSLDKPLAGVILDDEIESTSVNTGTLVVKGGVGISGALNATTKSFNIQHPLDSNKRLCYGSLESPYHGIRLTGENVTVNGECIVKLPEYISKLVKTNNAQVQITNIKHDKILWVDDIDILNNQFIIKTNEKSDNYKFYWSFTAIRSDVDDLIVEYMQ